MLDSSILHSETPINRQCFNSFSCSMRVMQGNWGKFEITLGNEWDWGGENETQWELIDSYSACKVVCRVGRISDYPFARWTSSTILLEDATMWTQGLLFGVWPGLGVMFIFLRLISLITPAYVNTICRFRGVWWVAVYEMFWLVFEIDFASYDSGVLSWFIKRCYVSSEHREVLFTLHAQEQTYCLLINHDSVLCAYWMRLQRVWD